jgi:hypothetical protein
VRTQGLAFFDLLAGSQQMFASCESEEAKCKSDCLKRDREDTSMQPMSPMSPMRLMQPAGEPTDSINTSALSPDVSGEHEVGCLRALAKKGIYGLAECCANCHETDGLQLAYVDGEAVYLCCMAITEIALKWPASIECTDEITGRRLSK